MLIPINSIYIPPEKDARIRDPENLAEGIKMLLPSILRMGQLVPIGVVKMKKNVEGQEWYLVDGMTRWATIQTINAQMQMGMKDVEDQMKAVDLPIGMIKAEPMAKVDDLTLLMMEFHANDDRQGFTWDEKAKYVRMAHEMLSKQNKGWNTRKTGAYLNMSDESVRRYLNLSDPESKAAQSPAVKKAKTFRTAAKQLNIAKERERHEKMAELKEKRIEAAAQAAEEGDEVDVKLGKRKIARTMLHLGDCRTWIKDIPKGALGWFHWDPPYGGAEGDGGAFTSFEGIEEDHNYCLKLMQDMIPEIWRVLFDGAWLVMWFTPIHYQRIRLMLQGHQFNDEGTCIYCSKNLVRDYIWLTENYSCRKSPHRFWVNPYPCVWYKRGYMADGHEIQRFFTKQTEYFLIAGKNRDVMPVLMDSNRGNVFDFPPIPRSARRHVHHKPVELLKTILSAISVGGSIGGDAGFGSGSIIEAAVQGGRKVVAAEKRKEHFNEVLGMTTDLLVQYNVGEVPWLAKPEMPDLENVG